MQKLILPWIDPLKLAEIISQNYREESWAFLYSGLHKEVKKSVSYIGIFPHEKIVTEDFFTLEKTIKSSDKKWFGYLSYEVSEQFEKLPKSKDSFINLPKIYLINFAVTLEFHHDQKKLVANFIDKKNLNLILEWKEIKASKKSSKIINLDSNFSDESYLSAISDIKKMISCGDFYQTNLTRKFFGNFSKKQTQVENFQLFKQLSKLSPANYSAFLKLDKNYIISSSPELFLKAENGKILSRPIKGTAPRSTNSKQDQQNKSYLKNSIKERAENLMIVDLVRNDLARICKAGSVKVKNLFAINSYKNIHHMSSEIHGKIDPEFSAFDAIKTCFAPGSMTGAPKIKAMEIAAKKEGVSRGVYSGSIGIFSKDSINSSVVIRTLITQDDKFEFQVGGAITFDSDEKSELLEIFNKAKGLAKLLRIRLGE